MERKEAIKIVRKLYNESLFLKKDKEAMVTLIPELKESEDERIRKGLIAIITDFESLYLQENYSLSKEEALAWVEKQGEHTNFLSKIQIGDKVTRNKDGALVNLAQLNRVAKKDEKQSEQKPADKIEPKFKVGDWVVDIQGVAFNRIINYEDECYQIETCCSKFWLPIHITEKNYRLWTIQDAKDGDVLSTDTWTFIFKKYQDKSAYYHCSASTFNDFSISDTGEFNSNYVHPATKEQRDLLFQKMRDAGYEWDAEHKQLKKIEQKPVWSEEDELMLVSVIQTLKLTNGAAQIKIDWLKSLRPQNQQESIEDRVNNFFDALGDCGYMQDEILRFKSLWKQAGLLKPQNTWKLSELQMKALGIAIRCGIQLGTWEEEALKSLKEQLRKLMEK